VWGDANGSGEVDIDDVVYLIAYIFSGGPEPVPYESGDANCSESVDIDDVVWLITYIFSSGPAPCQCGTAPVDVCVFVNDGEQFIFPDNWNTLEIWIENDVYLAALTLGFEITWTDSGSLTWDMSYGNYPPVMFSSEAVSSFNIILEADNDFDQASPDHLVLWGVSATAGFPVGGQRLFCSLRFFANGNPGNLCVKPYFYAPGGSWMVVGTGGFPPDFCGWQVPDPNDPVAPSVCF
jgi:hypothetical protein